MPALTVTLIGVVVAVILSFSRRASFWAILGLGFIGAWAGFLMGALLGVTLDVLTNDGIFVAIIGHMGAGAGAIFALIRFTKVKRKN